MLALEGIKVLDFCRNAPGMFATMILADLEIWPESGGSRASGYTWSQQA